MAILHEEAEIICYDDKIEIKHYYFPAGLSKVIFYKDIKSFHEDKLTLLNGKGRLWGMNLSPYWFNWDIKRFSKTKMIAIHLGSTINPAITPDNHEKVLAILKEKTKNN